MKPGDKVVCVDADYGLTFLRCYTVKHIHRYIDSLVQVNGFSNFLKKSRFILLDSPVGLQTLSQETKES